MSVMFPKYFGMPHAVIRSGLWAKMKPSEQSLYVALMHDSERYRTRALERSDAQIRELAGLSSRALCDARKKLQERGLICCERGLGNVYRYAICNPETGQPWPGDPRKIVFYGKKGGDLQVGTDNNPVVLETVPKSPPSGVPVAAVIDSEPLESWGLPGLFK